MMSNGIRWALVAMIALAVGLPDRAGAQSSRERSRQSRDVSPFSNDSAGQSSNRSSSRRSSSSSQNSNGRSSAQNSTSNNTSNNGRPGLGQPGSQPVRGFTRTQTTGKPGGALATAGKGTTSTVARGKSPVPGGAKGPGGQGGVTGAGFGMSGQIKEVTKSLADSLRPVRIDYDAEEMAEKPGVIILNSRRHRPDQEKSRSGSRSGRSESLVRPL